MNLRFDSQKVGSAEHASAALLRLHARDRSLDPAPCIFLLISQDVFYVSLTVLFQSFSPCSRLSVGSRTASKGRLFFQFSGGSGSS